MFISTRDEHIVVHNEQEHRDITLHCVQWGTQGEPIVLIHGLTANAFCFQAIVEALAPITAYLLMIYVDVGIARSQRAAIAYPSMLLISRPSLTCYSLNALSLSDTRWGH